ncbi:hypothetical protein [Mesorhizobium sp. M0036]|uniref:hypothetical protein n=1 Tax=Mesorhizobium sp. M0036 TaxID=2956853 RepID=UPI0033370DBA
MEAVTSQPHTPAAISTDLGAIFDAMGVVREPVQDAVVLSRDGVLAGDDGGATAGRTVNSRI